MASKIIVIRKHGIIFTICTIQPPWRDLNPDPFICRLHKTTQKFLAVQTHQFVILRASQLAEKRTTKSPGDDPSTSEVTTTASTLW
jgi:hypothetical protein